MRLYHGGVPGLKAGDVITPGHDRRVHDGCPFCEARARGESPIIDPLARPDRVYATTNRLYAKHYASLWGRGDLYRVAPVGELEFSVEDTVESYCAEVLTVAAVLDRAVLLTWSERRRLYREWGIADNVRLAVSK
jgi:hypothetical protein